MTGSKRTLVRSLLIALLILLPSVIYMQGLPGDYVLDDLSNIVSNRLVHMQEMTWLELKQAANSMPRREVSRASFGINHYFGGLDPYGYKLVNIAIHVVNGLLVFFLARLLALQALKKTAGGTEQYPLFAFSILVALIWLLHPINVTSVLYVVQRMTSLSALFVMLGMIAYITGRRMLEDRPKVGATLMLSSVVVFTPLAWFSKENGALLPLYLFLLEWIFFCFKSNNRRLRYFIVAFFFLILVVPGLYAVYYIFNHPGYFHGSYFSKYYSLTERLLTEARVVWHYVRMILLPWPNLYGLYLDDIPLSVSLIKPVTTLLAIASTIASLLISWVIRHRAPLLSFGILFFFAGHLMESTFIPLEIAFEHRNYLPAIGLLLPLLFYALFPSWHPNSLKIRYFLTYLFLVIGIAITWTRVMDWRSNASLHLAEVAHHPQSPRANYEAGRVYGMMLEQGIGDRDENINRAFDYFRRATELRGDITSGLFGMIIAAHDAGYRLEEKWYRELEQRLENQPYGQTNIAWISSLNRCIRLKKCTPESTQLKALIEASVKNTKTNRRTKAMIYSAASDYYLNIERNIGKALEYAQMAVQQQSSQVELYLQLARLQIINRQTRMALKSLDRANKADKHGIHGQQIRDLKNIARRLNQNERSQLQQH
jgi:hypothetical protein